MYWQDVGELEKEKVERTGQINMFRAIVPEGLNAIGDDEWEELEMAMDSGATESVVGENMLTSVELQEGEAYRRGVRYEVADGTLISNKGEKRFVGVNEDGQERKMTVQVCDVNKALLSVKKVVKAGNRVVFEEGSSYVENVDSGERMYMKEQDGGMYTLKFWVKRSPF